jgi:cell division protein FtsB
VTRDPTARALRALHTLAADLAAERRESARLRRRIADLQAEVERLRAAAAPARARTARHAPGPRPKARVVDGS